MKISHVPGTVLSTYIYTPVSDMNKLNHTEAIQTCSRGYNFEPDCGVHALNHCNEGNAGRAVCIRRSKILSRSPCSHYIINV